MQFLTRGLTRLTDFSGRDARRLFWPYAGAVILLMIIVMGAVNSVFITRIIAKTPADQMFDLSGMVLAMGVEIAAIVALLAAAVARRLHDTGRAAYWGLTPLPFVIFSLVGFYGLVRSFDRPIQGVPALFFPIFFSNLLYMASLVTLIALLAQPSKPEANRYGEPPAP